MPRRSYQHFWPTIWWYWWRAEVSYIWNISEHRLTFKVATMPGVDDCGVFTDNMPQFWLLLKIPWIWLLSSRMKCALILLSVYRTSTLLVQLKDGIIFTAVWHRFITNSGEISSITNHRFNFNQKQFFSSFSSKIVGSDLGFWVCSSHTSSKAHSA